MSQGGGRGFQGFLFLIYPMALLPVGLAYVARYAFESEVMFGLVLAFRGRHRGVFYWIALESAVNAAGRRREQILQELSRSDGPVVRRLAYCFDFRTSTSSCTEAALLLSMACSASVSLIW